MAMMSKREDFSEAKPLLPTKGSNAITKKKGTLVLATFKHCRDAVIDLFNLELTSPALTQAGILPKSFRNRFIKIENIPEQLDSLMNVLCGCSEDQFWEVIQILRATTEEAGVAHVELVKDLEDTFNRFKAEGYTYEANAITITHEVHPMSQQYVYREAPNEAPEENCIKKLRDILNEKRRDRKCQAHCVYHSCIVATVFLVLLPFFSSFFSLYPPTNSEEVEPSLLAGSNLMTVQFGSNYQYLHWIWKLVMLFERCSGQVFAFRNTNCSILDEAITGTPLSNSSWYGFTPKFFLSGSNFAITNVIADFVILKSLATFSSYKQLCKELDDVNERGSCLRNATSHRLCNETHQLPQALKKNVTFWCYDKEVDFPIYQSDFYFVVITSGAKPHPTIGGIAYAYSPSKISSLVSNMHESVDVYNYESNSSLSIPMSGQGAPLIYYEENCVLLNATCNGSCDSSCPINEITYSLHRGFVATLVSCLLLVVILFLLLGVWHLPWKRCRRGMSSQSSINCSS